MAVANPKWLAMLGSSVAKLPGVMTRTAGRVVSDIGSKDPAVAKAALRMVGMHAGTGALAGGLYSSYNGDSFARGAVRGGIAGGAFGIAGGVGSVGRAMRSSFGNLHSRAERASLSSFETAMMKSGKDPETLEMIMGIQRKNAARNVRTARNAYSHGAVFSGIHDTLMGGYNPYLASTTARAAGSSAWKFGKGFKLSGGFAGGGLFNLSVG